jgi:hypothetical protein
MKSSIITILTAVGLLQLGTSCVNSEREIASSTKDPRSVYVPPTGAGRRVSNVTVLNTVRASHSFSDPKTKDNFLLQLRGPRILTSRLHLIVLTAKGDTLRHEVMPARALLQGTEGQSSKMLTARDQEIAILRRMNGFFSEDRFTNLTVSGTTAKPAGLDAKAWDTLRADQNAVSFEYPSIGGNDRRLAYSRQLGRAVVLSD